MWLWIALIVVVVLLAILLAPNPNKNGGSIDAFIKKVDESKLKSQVKQADPYKRVFLSPGKQILIFYGTEYGFGENVGKKLYDEVLKIEGFQPRLVNMSQFQVLDFSKEQVVLAICSTCGDGVPPLESRGFHDWLSSSSFDFSHLRFSVLALGDSAYPHFCRAGLSVFEKLSAQSAQLIAQKETVDLEDWSVINRWFNNVLAAIQTISIEERTDYLDVESLGSESNGPSRMKPFYGPMTVKVDLTKAIGPGSNDKEVLHCEFDLRGSELSYTAGDALGIYPFNNPSEVDTLLLAIGSRATTRQRVDIPAVYAPAPDGNRLSLREALLKYYDLKSAKPDLLKLVVDKCSNPADKARGERLLASGLGKENTFLAEYLGLREIVDILEDFPSSGISLTELLGQMKLLQPRYYSISSSPFVSTDCSVVAVTAAVVRYQTLGKPRTGVCTTFISDRLKIGQDCAIFVNKNPDFRLPANPDVPVIMIGPGTGIAPFRAFLQERTGRTVINKVTTRTTNVFYFGCRHRDLDFIYKDELQQLEAEGKLVLRVAFSREQVEKVYVQHLILQDASYLWGLLQQGAHIYVCGDAKNMAKDVHQALLTIFQQQGTMSHEDAEKFIQGLEAQHRYQRDVWV